MTTNMAKHVLICYFSSFDSLYEHEITPRIVVAFENNHHLDVLLNWDLLHLLAGHYFCLVMKTDFFL